MTREALTYAEAGVNIDAGNRAVALMKDSVRATYTDGVLGDVGGFGGLFALTACGHPETVLVAGTDGVGTKLRLAIDMDRHDTIGQDCVAMSVNDVLVQGATPLFFLDYIATGELLPEQIASIVAGVARACRESGCALLGGETAEMAGFYAAGDYDLAGFAVGAVARDRVITGETIAAGDVVLGLPSSGVHSNGYSLVRKIIAREGLDLTRTYGDLGAPLGDVLLTPTRLYVRAVAPLFGRFDVKGIVHITGGGFYDNIPRVLPEGLGVKIDPTSYPLPPIFPQLASWGNVPRREMYRTFNMGLGMLLIASPQEAERIVADLESRGETVYTVGEVTTSGTVEIGGVE